MSKVVSWSPDMAKRILKQRFESAQQFRMSEESQWVSNYQIINNANSNQTSQINISFTNMVGLNNEENDQSSSTIGTNYAFKFLRFLHSQLSANPPAAMAKPSTTDAEDRRKADAADRILRHSIRAYDIQEIVDQLSLKMLIYGTAWIKVVWDPDKGDITQFDEKTNEVTMEGDIHISAPDVGNVWPDPDATIQKNIRFIFERIQMSQEEALFLYPDFAEEINNIAVNTKSNLRNLALPNPGPDFEPQVEIIEYYERGMPVNGMAGRFVRFLTDYTLLCPVTKNPHPDAGLPYHAFTYLDVPDKIFGKSIVEYVADIQDMLNRMDSSIVDSVQAHGVVRMVIPGDCEIEEESISDSSWDWIKTNGMGKPSYINPPALMPDLWKIRTQLQQAIQDLYGINDSQLGIQKREQSAVSQQTAIEQGTMIHRRLFKKYERLCEFLYTDVLALARENWKVARTIMVIGKENAFEAADFKGADIDGGFDLVVEYGTSLPLDPNLRRESILLLTPVLKEAGMSAKQILQYMKLNDLEGIYDRMELSAERQRETFEEMIAKLQKGVPPEKAYIAPVELEEHQGRLEYAYTYIETADFKYLPEIAKDMIRMHIKEREQLLAQAATKGQTANQGGGLPAPSVGSPSPSAPGATSPVPGLPAGLPGVRGAVLPGTQASPGTGALAAKGII